MTSLPSLGELVAALPEIYQPIYGHPEFDSRAARTLEDRLAQILGVYEALSRKLGRPLRKSELLRAGLLALKGLSDKALLAAITALPALKTGRPRKA